MGKIVALFSMVQAILFDNPLDFKEFHDDEAVSDEMQGILKELKFVPVEDPKTGQIKGFSIVNCVEDGFFAKSGYKFGQQVVYYSEAEIDFPDENDVLLKQAIRYGSHNL